VKQIVAVVKPFLAGKLISTALKMEVDEISIREVKGYGRQKNYLDRYGENVMKVARTGRLGDGKFFIMPVANNHPLLSC